jgi:hypothetical protein
MSLNLSKLEKVRELAGGLVQARCPACAEGGNDRSGEHLRIYPDGRFGCCVHPKDGEHRKRIFALVGVRQPGSFSLRLKTPPALPPAQSVKAALTALNAGTLGTAKTESVSSGKMASQTSQDSDHAKSDLQSKYFGTLGTPISNPRAYRKKAAPNNIDTPVYMCKDLESAVPSVPTPCGGPPLPPATGEKLPFLTAGGDLSIPFDSPKRYHWWRGGQSVAATLAEVRSRMSKIGKD